MLTLENIHTHYGKIEALHGVSVEINEGEIVSLIGANGAGKTTLLMTVATPRPVLAGSSSVGRILPTNQPQRSCAPVSRSCLKGAESSQA